MIEAMFISLLGPTLAGALMLCILAGAFTCFLGLVSQGCNA